METMLRQLQVFTRERGVRWEDLFSDFDRHNVKRVNEDAFRRGLAASGFAFGPGQVEQAVAAFRVPHTEVVAYRDFCDAIESAFVRKGLEKRPAANVPLMKPDLAQPTTKLHELDQDEQRRLEAIISLIGRRAKVERVELKRFWVDFDTRRCGFVSSGQFQRGLAFLLSREKSGDYAEAAELLIRAYSNSRDEINYRKLAQDVEQHISAAAANQADGQLRGAATLQACGSPVARSPSNNMVDCIDVEQTLQEMRDVVATEGIAVRQYFSDLDRSRTGLVSRDRFKKAVASAFGNRIHLGPALLNSLADRYSNLASFSERGEAGLEHMRIVDYRRFQEDVEPAIAQLQSLHLRPTQKVDSAAFRRPGRSGTEETEEGTEDSLIARLRIYVRKRRVNLKPNFLDFDQLHRGTITAGQFRRVLSIEFAPLELGQADFDQLITTFTREATGDVEYRRFLKVVEQDPAEAQRSQAPTALPFYMEDSKGDVAPGAGLSRAAIMLRLQRQITSLGVRLGEFLTDADRTNHGLIRFDDLVRGFSRARIDLTPAEAEVIAGPYMNSSSTELRWRDLLEEIQLVEVTCRLEKTPMHPGSGQALPPQASFPTSEMSAETANLLAQLRDTVRTNRVEILPAFKIHDRHNSGKLEQTLFRRALESLTLRPLQRQSESAFDSIAEAFAEGQGSLGLVVNYRAFVRAVTSDDTTSLAQSALGSAALPLATAGPRGRGTPSGLDPVAVENLLRRLQDQAWSRGIRVRDFVETFDRMRKGLIPAAKFNSALQMSGLVLNPDDLGLLLAQYKSSTEPGMVAYLPFVHALDGGDEKLECAPRGELRSRRARCFEEAHPASADQDELEAILQPMRQLVHVRHLHVLESFKDRDRKNIKAVSKGQFAAVLKTYGLLPLHDNERILEVLHRAYPARHPENISYTRFTQDLEKR